MLLTHSHSPDQQVLEMVQAGHSDPERVDMGDKGWNDMFINADSETDSDLA